MTIRSHSLNVLASMALFVMISAGLASCGGGGGGSKAAPGNTGDEIIIEPRPSQDSPDLTVVSPSVSDNNPTAGASFTLSATVSNTGDGESPATTLRYYRSTDATITTSDTLVGADAVGTLAAAGTSAGSISLTAPSSPGTYYYGACVDSVSGESDTTNNCSASAMVQQRTQRGPDPVVLGVSLASGDPDGSPGRSFTLRSRVRNHGDVESPATTLRFHVSGNRPIEVTDNTLVGSVAVGPIAASGGTSGALLLSLTALRRAGTYYYGACVDAVAGEADTTNNCTLSLAITVEPSPDLIVLGPVVTEIQEDRTFWLFATVHNRGAGRSAATTVRAKRSTDATITTSDTTVGTDEVVTFIPSGGTVARIELAAPSTPGTYYYGACVDPVSRESDTTNNCSTSSARLDIN